MSFLTFHIWIFCSAMSWLILENGDALRSSKTWTRTNETMKQNQMQVLLSVEAVLGALGPVSG
jgi:hypothetical protein